MTKVMDQNIEETARKFLPGLGELLGGEDAGGNVGDDVGFGVWLWSRREGRPWSRRRGGRRGGVWTSLHLFFIRHTIGIFVEIPVFNIRIRTRIAG